MVGDIAALAEIDMPPAALSPAWGSLHPAIPVTINSVAIPAATHSLVHLRRGIDN